MKKRLKGDGKILLFQSRSSRLKMPAGICRQNRRRRKLLLHSSVGRFSIEHKDIMEIWTQFLKHIFCQGTLFFVNVEASFDPIRVWYFFARGCGVGGVHSVGCCICGNQCDQIWRKFATLAKVYIMLVNFWQFISYLSKYWAYFGKFGTLLG